MMYTGHRPPSQPLHKRDPRAVKLRVERLYHEAEKVIEDAISSEKLKENPFKGKPLRLDENPFDRGFGMAHRMLKSSGHTLPWIETKKEIIQERKAIDQAVEDHLAWLKRRLDQLRASKARGEEIRRLHDDHARFLEYLRDRVTQLRQTIERYNLEVPLVDQQVPNVRPETYLKRAQESANPLFDQLGVE